MDKSSLNKHLPIDRGWAWVITVATLGVFGYATGNYKCQGMIYVELLEMYPDASAQSLLWVFGVWSIINRLSGPLNGLLLAKTSNRTMSMMGVLLMTSSLVVFAYLPRYEYMYLVYGIIAGIGAGMMALSAFTAHIPYFEKRKALSVSLTASGSGVGGIVLPILLRHFFDKYTFSGAILLYAGVCLQMLVLAALLRPMSYYERMAELKNSVLMKSSSISESSQEQASLKPNDVIVKDEAFRERSFSVGAQQENKELETFLSVPHDLHTNSGADKVSPRDRRLHVSNSILAYSAMDITSDALVFGSINPQIGQRNAEEVQTIPKLSLWKLALHPKCILIGVATTLFVSGFGASFPCLPPLGETSGVDRQLVAILLAVSGAIEIPSRIINGWLADRKLVSAYTQLGICMLCTGVAALLCGLISGVAGIAIMSIVLGVMGTSVFSLLPVASGELLGAENLQNAIAINYGYQGLSGVASVAASGLIFDSTQRWEIVFLYISACCTAGSLGMFAFTISAYLRGKKQKQMKTKNTT